MDSNVTAISLKNVDFSYPNRPFKVLDDFSLDVMQHEVIAVIGKSGCGKSTLIRCMNGLEEVTAGEVYIDGHRMTHKTRAALNRHMSRSS